MRIYLKDEPRRSDFETDEEYEAALIRYEDALSDYEMECDDDR